MVKVSHAKCRQCGNSRHRNAKFNLCGRCWTKRKGEYAAGWREIKARRALKRANGVAHEEEPIVVAEVSQFHEEEVVMPRGRAPSLTPEHEAEIVNLYTTTDQSVREIARAYGIGETVPYRILTKYGISWRRGDDSSAPQRELPPHIEAMKEVHVARIPALPPFPTPKPLTVEEAVASTPTPTPRPVPTLVETVADMAAPESDGQAERLKAEHMPRWHVEFTSSCTVHAANARDAIAAAEEQYSARNVTLVRLTS